MTPHDPHAPRAEFVDALEREVLRAYRAEAPATKLSASPPRRWREQWRVAAALIIGLALGGGVPLASAQVQNARARSELERSLEVEREVRTLRLQIAQQEHQRARQAFAAGALSQQSLLMAAAELREKEVDLARIDIDLAEVRITSAPPRDELWAPQVGGRDFVKQRLQLLASLAQQRLNAMEGSLITERRAMELGTGNLANMLATQMQVGVLAAELDRVAMQLKVRDQALAERLEPAEVTRRLQSEILTIEMARAAKVVDILTARLEMARQQFRAGTMKEIELRRLELDLMERQIELDRMQAERRSRINWQFGRNKADSVP